ILSPLVDQAKEGLPIREDAGRRYLGPLQKPISRKRSRKRTRFENHAAFLLGDRFKNSSQICEGGLSANLFNRISNPAVNDWPLVVSPTEIEKVRLVCL